MKRYSSDILFWFFIFAIWAVILFGLNFFVLWLWNGIVVPKFGAPVFSYWEMYGLCLMIRMILPTSAKFSGEGK